MLLGLGGHSGLLVAFALPDWLEGRGWRGLCVEGLAQNGWVQGWRTRLLLVLVFLLVLFLLLSFLGLIRLLLRQGGQLFVYGFQLEKHTHTHTCAHTRAHTHTRARTHARAHTHTHTHTHTQCVPLLAAAALPALSVLA